jgi:hypothetical protein
LIARGVPSVMTAPAKTAAVHNRHLSRRPRLGPRIPVKVSCSDGAEARNRSSYSLTVMTFLSKTRMRINGINTHYALADALPVVAEGFHTTAVKAATIALDAS